MTNENWIAIAAAISMVLATLTAPLLQYKLMNLRNHAQALNQPTNRHSLLLKSSLWKMLIDIVAFILPIYGLVSELLSPSPLTKGVVCRISFYAGAILTQIVFHFLSLLIGQILDTQSHIIGLHKEQTALLGELLQKSQGERT